MKFKVFSKNFRNGETLDLKLEPYSHYKLANTYLEFGDINDHRNDAVAKLNLKKPLKNLQVSLDFTMVDDYENSTWWFGVKVRSTSVDQNDGYLIYLRSNGNAAIYSGGIDLAGSPNQLTAPIINRRVRLDIEVIDNRFIIRSDDNKVIYEDKDNKLPRAGDIYLYANHTKNNVHRIEVWKIVKAHQAINIDPRPWAIVMILFFLVATIIYKLSPDTIKKLNDNPVILLWDKIKF